MNYYIIILGFIIIIVIIILLNKKVSIIQDNKRVVITLTTTPKRLPLIEDTILSLVNQTRQPDLIYLNIPEYYKKECSKYNQNNIVNLINKIPILKINNCVDKGPITKIYPVLDIETNPETIIITVDDDHIYNRNMIQELLKTSNNNPDKIICNYLYTFNNIVVPYGFKGVLYKRKFFDDDIKLYIDETNNYTHCFTSDDYVLGYYFDFKKIEVVLSKNIVELDELREYGLKKEDALHLSLLPNKERYGKCHNFITKVLLD